MHTSNGIRLILSVLLLFVVISVGTGIARAADKVSIILNWIPVGYHVGFFVAKDKGFFSRERIDVDIISGKGSGVAVKSVATGTADVGLADAGTLVPARARGLKARMVGTFFERSPMVVFVLKNSPLRTPKDLVGKTLAAAVGSASRVLFPALAKANGFSPDAVKWLTIKPSAEPITLMTKKADGIPTFLTAKPNFEKAAAQMGLQVRMIRYADYGLDLYGLSLMSGDDWIRKKPRLLRAFLKGAYQGIKWAIENPEEGIDILLKSHPALGRNSSLVRWAIARELMVTPTVKQKGLGYIDPSKAKLLRDVIVHYQNVKGPVEVSDLYTNDFLPGIFPPG